MKSLIFAAVLLALAAAASAQTTLITPATGITFTASSDHGTTFGGQPILTNYQAEFFTVTGTTCPAPTGTPIVASLGKPMPNAQNVITFAPIAPLVTANTLYCGYVSAVGPGGTSARTNAVGPFGLPGKPSAPTGAGLTP